MQSKLILDAEQRILVDEMLSTSSGAYLIASIMGEGKTVCTVEYMMATKPETTLIICPLNTRVGWERTLRQQGYEGKIVRIESTPEGKAEYAHLAAGVPGVYLIGREYMALSATTVAPKIKLDGTYTRGREAVWSWKKVKPNLAVYDEIHAVQNRNATMSHVLRTLKADFKVGLSGTWAGNKFQGAWAPTRWLWPTVIDTSFWRWVAEYCTTEFDPFAGKKVTGELVPGAFVKDLPAYGRIESTLTTPMVTEYRFVELSSAQRKAYRQMETDLIAWLDDHPIVADLPVTARIRLRQITLGMPSFTEDGEIGFDVKCKSTKLEALKEILSDLEDEPVLILTDSQRFARVAVARLGRNAVEWSGQVSAHAREGILERFGKPGGPKYIVATIAAIGEGVDGLQLVCNNMVWLSRSENGLLNDQASKRLHRRGQTKPVRSIEILATETLDEGILSSLIEQRLTMRASLRKG